LIRIDILLSFVLLESEAENEVSRRDDLSNLFPLLFPVGPVEEELFCGGGNRPFVWKDFRLKDDLSYLPLHDGEKGIFSTEFVVLAWRYSPIPDRSLLLFSQLLFSFFLNEKGLEDVKNTNLGEIS
jgi:hypothetical protein